LNNLGEQLALEGHYPEAESLYRQARDIWQKSFGPQHPYVAVNLTNLNAGALDSGTIPSAALPETWPGSVRRA
jgi:hypothetical protein